METEYACIQCCTYTNDLYSGSLCRKCYKLQFKEAFGIHEDELMQIGMELGVEAYNEARGCSLEEPAYNYAYSGRFIPDEG